MRAFAGIVGMQRFAAMICLVAVMLGNLQPGDSAEPQCADSSSAARLDIAALPNAFCLNDQVFSGGQPAGEEGFKALRQLGVRTVISVDGAKPELAIAKQFSLAYVHLPHGYDGISPQRAIELAKAVGELPGPIYIHCHHGKHRSPAAAAVACIGAGLMTPADGQRLLKLAGTSKDYRGLHQVVAQSQRVPHLASIEVEFSETVDVPPLATSMVQIERTFDHLKQVEQSGWKAPRSHPDLGPAHEALLLREHFTELLRTKEILARPVAFRNMLELSRSKAESLENALRDSSTTPAAATTDRWSGWLAAIGGACTRCHREYRD